MSVQTAYELAAVWYRGRMTRGWNPPGSDEAEAIFQRFDFDWSLLATLVHRDLQRVTDTPKPRPSARTRAGNVVAAVATLEGMPEWDIVLSDGLGPFYLPLIVVVRGGDDEAIEYHIDVNCSDVRLELPGR
jgi:hypothetical protein